MFIVGRSAERLKSAEEALGKETGVIALAADMTKEADIVRLFKEVGEFDHLVVTAGSPPTNYPIGDTDMDAVRAFVDNKLWVPSCSPSMRSAGSRPEAR